jgi:hypothetical protein
MRVCAAARQIWQLPASCAGWCVAGPAEVAALKAGVSPAALARAGTWRTWPDQSPSHATRVSQTPADPRIGKRDLHDAVEIARDIERLLWRAPAVSGAQNRVTATLGVGQAIRRGGARAGGVSACAATLGMRIHHERVERRARLAGGAAREAAHAVALARGGQLGDRAAAVMDVRQQGALDARDQPERDQRCRQPPARGTHRGPDDNTAAPSGQPGR